MTRPADPAHDPAVGAVDPAGADAPAGPPRPPSRADPTVWRATRAIGGAWGRRAALPAFSWWTPVRWLLVLTTITLLLGFAQKSPCATGDWTGNKQYTHFCYSDVIPLWSDERLDQGAVPYRDTGVEYPVLTGAFMWLTADLTRGVHALTSSVLEVTVFGLLTAILLAMCAYVVTVATAGASRRRPYDAAIFALSPLLMFHAFTNWDLLAMAFASCALWAWARGAPVLSGAMIALGTAAKLYPVFLLVPLLTLALRTGRWRGAVWCTVSAAGTWLAVNGPIALAYPHGWWQFYKFSMDRPTERSSIWAIGKALADGKLGSGDTPYWVPPGWAVAGAVIVGVVAVVMLGLLAPQRPRVAQLAFLVVLVFLLTTKVWSPQYSLWLVPLLALARPRWRLNLVWQCTEVGVWMLTLTLLLGYTVPAHGVAYGWLVLLLVARDVMLLVLAGLIIREMWQPWLDVVRVDGTDDPAGGEFDRAPDAVAVREAALQPEPVTAGAVGGPSGPSSTPET